LRDQRSNLSESYASERSAIQFSTSNGPPRSILITSTTPSEGKSSSALALARSFAFLRQRTLIIDGDLRNPSLQGDTKRKRGFAHLLTGSAQADECIEPTSIEGLFLIQCGMVPPNPTELLGSPRARSVITFLESQFDIVIIDGPPILGLADAPLLSSICEGTIMIVQAEHARRSTIRAALRRLHAAKGNVIGSILTKFKSGFGSYSYGYGYGYGYGYDYGYGGEMQMNAGRLNLLTMDD
jgi:capsular exopolysaccharide synthesis family protein